MKRNQKHSRIVLSCAILATVILCPWLSKATPYASCITNNAGIIQFYLNESGGNATITYEDGSTNSNFNGLSTGTALPSGQYSFTLAPHTSYTISVTKTGTGNAAVVHTMPAATPRGIDVNKRPASPYFGFVYAVNAAGAQTNAAGGATNTIRLLNSDLSGVLTNGGGVSWVAGSSSSPYRLAVNEDDFLTVGDFSSAHSGVWRIDPTLTTNQLLLGPIGQTAGYAAGSQGDQFSRPLLVGNLASGGSGVLYTVDAGSIPNVNASQLNSILVYSNITLATLPRITPPDLVGPEVCLNMNLQNNYPGITVGPNGYIYASNRRDGPGGGTADLYIFDADLNPVWNSLYNNGVNDYFATMNTGTPAATTGPADSAVSADGKYVAAVGYGDNHIIVCSLTNGVPDVSTLYTISNTVSQVSAGRGLSWDAADNVYVSSSGGTTFQEWTLGFTATAVTTGNASGSTGFSLDLPSTFIGVVATNSIGGASVSQVNSIGNPTNATFIVTRTGNDSAPTVIPFTLSGTAPTGSYTASATGSITIAAGQSSTNITVTAVSDGVARAGTTITLTLATSPNYTLAPAFATLSLINTAPNILVASPLASSMYNAFSNDYASFVITRLGDTNAATYSVGSYTFAGTAVAGVDYSTPGSVTFNPGDLTVTNYISPLSNGQLPVDTTTNSYVGNKTVIIGIGGGTDYSGGTNTATLTIIDSANPTAVVLYSDPLTDPSDAVHWGVTSANNNMQTNDVDNTVIFGYNLQNGDPGDYGAIPLPPSGAATALRVTVNKDANPGAAAGVNLYPTNITFTGNYAVRFNMNIIEGAAGSSTTEGPLFGIDHSGKDTNWWSGSSILSGWGPNNSETWSSDGVWYWASADGDAALGDFVEFTGLGGTNGNTGWTTLATGDQATFANEFKTNIFTSSGGPGLVANGSVANDSTANNWSDVEIKQLNGVVTLSIDKTPVFTYTNTTTFTNGMVMLGYNDPFSSVGGLDGAVYYSNLRVVSIATVTTPLISQIALNKVNATVVINFTTTDGGLTASSFTVQSASVVTGPYTDATGVSVTSLGGGAFQAVLPQGGSSQFYRIHESN